MSYTLQILRNQPNFYLYCYVNGIDVYGPGVIMSEGAKPARKSNLQRSNEKRSGRDLALQENTILLNKQVLNQLGSGLGKIEPNRLLRLNCIVLYLGTRNSNEKRKTRSHNQKYMHKK